jgi:Zn-dependent protease with chaperone function
MSAVTLERTSFQEEQARRRRGTWRISLACLAIASALGIVMSTVLTPLILIAAGGLLRLLGLVPGLGSPAGSLRHALGGWLTGQLARFERFLDAIDKLNGLTDVGSLGPSALGMAGLMLPGIAAAGLVWLLFVWAIRRTGLRDLVASLNARPPRGNDIEERQLANLVDEMALAAGLPSPGLLVVDSEAVNAAAVGSTPEDASVIVTRGMLDRLGREETGAAVAHCVASIGHGDLKVSASVLAVLQTLGLLLSILDLPFRGTAWRGLYRFAPLAVGLSSDPQRLLAAERDFETAMNSKSSEEIGRFMPEEGKSRLKFLITLPLLPLILLTLFMKMIVVLWVPLFLGPPLTMLFRNRRYLADAGAVQLTRDPDAVVAALTAIASSSLPEGGESRDFLFVHAQGGGKRGGMADRQTLPAALTPSLEARCVRLAAMGARVQVTPHRALRALLANRRAAVLVALLCIPLVPLVGMLVFMTLLITAGFMLFSLAGGLALASFVVG